MTENRWAPRKPPASIQKPSRRPIVGSRESRANRRSAMLRPTHRPAAAVTPKAWMVSGPKCQAGCSKNGSIEEASEAVEILRDDDPTRVALRLDRRDDFVVGAAMRAEVIEDEQLWLCGRRQLAQRDVARVKVAQVLRPFRATARLGGNFGRLWVHLVNQHVDAARRLLDRGHRASVAREDDRSVGRVDTIAERLLPAAVDDRDGGDANTAAVVHHAGRDLVHVHAIS